MTVSAEPNDGVEGLNDEQQALAARHLDVLAKLDAKFFDRARVINGGVQTDEDRDFDYDYAHYNVQVGRGPVVEKIGRMVSRVITPTSDIQRPVLFERYYGIDVHSETPLMGQVHAALYLGIYPDGTTAVGGTLNLLKGAAQEDDLQYVKEALDAVFEKHNVDKTPYRGRLCNGDTIENEKYHRKLACVGASFFGFPMLPATEENVLFVTEIYETFIDAYLDTLERRKDTPYTEDDLAAQDAMRKNWFEDQTYGDPYSSGGVTPYEVWGLAYLPPEVKF